MNIGSEAVFRIVNLTLPHLREGLDFRSAAATALILREVVGVSAVALSDADHILAFVGEGSDHHRAGLPILTHLTRETLLTGKVHGGLGGGGHRLPGGGVPAAFGYRGAADAPTTTSPGASSSTTSARPPSPRRRSSSPLVWLRCSRSSSSWPRSTSRSSWPPRPNCRRCRRRSAPTSCSTRSTPSRRTAAWTACTPRSCCRVRRALPPQPQAATGVWSACRRSWTSSTATSFEQHRFGERLRVERDHDPGALSVRVPPLVLQPIVENAVAHGVTQPGGGVDRPHPELRPGVDDVVLAVQDDGAGMDPADLAQRRGRGDRHAQRAAAPAGPLRIGVRPDGAHRPSRGARGSRCGCPAGLRAAPSPWWEPMAACAVRRVRAARPHRETNPQRELRRAETVRALIVDDEAPARTHLRALLEDVDGRRTGGRSLERDGGRDACCGRSSTTSCSWTSACRAWTASRRPSCFAELPKAPFVIFTTAYEEYAAKAFELGAADYLLKPISRARLEKALARAWDRKTAAGAIRGRAAAGPQGQGQPDAEVRDRSARAQDDPGGGGGHRLPDRRGRDGARLHQRGLVRGAGAVARSAGAGPGRGQLLPHAPALPGQPAVTWTRWCRCSTAPTSWS